jgi:hypothetical protein
MQPYRLNAGTDIRANNLRQFLKNRLLLENQFRDNGFVGDLSLAKDACICIQQKANDVKQGYNDPQQSINMRIAQILKNPATGGRVTFGNERSGITFLGGYEGQPGGLPQPPRNRL